MEFQNCLKDRDVKGKEKKCIGDASLISFKYTAELGFVQ